MSAAFRVEPEPLIEHGGTQLENMILHHGNRLPVLLLQTLLLEWWNR